MGIKMDKWISEMNKQGISNEHIEAMKDRIFHSSDYEFYYDIVDENEDDENKVPSLVDVNKIVGISTGWSTVDRSIYELFFGVTEEIPTKNGKTLKLERIEENLNSLINNGIQYQYNFYVDANRKGLRDGLPKFNYYMDDDVYFSGATHRTVSAIMFNAPKMIGYVTTYKKNPDKYNNYLIHKDTENKWKSFLGLELKHLNITKSEYKNNEYEVHLKDYPNIKIYLFFDNPLLEPENGKMTDSKRFEIEKGNVDELIQKLNEVNNYLELNSKELGFLPLLLRLLKKCNLRLPYITLGNFIYKKEDIIFKPGDSSKIIFEKIKKIVQKKTFEDNIPGGL